MTSLPEELQQEGESFDSDATVSPNKQRHDSLASELEHSLYGSDHGFWQEKPPQIAALRRDHLTYQDNSHASSQFLSLPRTKSTSLYSNASDYSGDEWGDPADDDDPDGRFRDLDRAIQEMLNCTSLDIDSAYISDEDEEDPSTSFDPYIDRKQHHRREGDLIDEFLSDLRRLPSQSSLEQVASRFIEAHKTSLWVLGVQLSGLKDLTQALHVAGMTTSDNDSMAPGEVLGLIDALKASVPEVDFAACNELMFVKAETTSLISDLSILRDTIQETRQIANAAGRALKSAKDACHQWQAEIEGVLKAKEWVDENRMDTKIRDRLVSAELDELRYGFAEYCEIVRQQFISRA